MTKARKRLIDPEQTPYYHCISRCVRRSYLCGTDHSTNTNFDHRKQWILDRIKLLSTVFSIDICAYAIMSNHYHLVLHINQAYADTFSNTEVIRRWCQVYKNKLGLRYLAGEKLISAEETLLHSLVDKWRSRLTDISWFMRALNHNIARRANKEDECTGHFWEGRFKSQALLDEGAVLSCMAYVDLNPVRANLSETPETSEFVSIQERIQEHRAEQQGHVPADNDLMPFQKPIETKERGTHATAEIRERSCLPFTRADYLELVDWTGKNIQYKGKSSIPGDLAPILTRLHLEPHYWLDHITGFHKHFKDMIGQVHLIEATTKALGKQWSKGVSSAEKFYRMIA